MNTTMEPFAALAQRAKERADQRRWQDGIRELVVKIDELSGEMGSIAFVEAVRVHGYDIDACSMTLSRRGITTH